MEEDLRDYFLYLKNEKRIARSTCTQALSAIKANIAAAISNGQDIGDVTTLANTEIVESVLGLVQGQQG